MPDMDRSDPPVWHASIGIAEDAHVHAHATLRRGVAPVHPSLREGSQIDEETEADVASSSTAGTSPACKQCPRPDSTSFSVGTARDTASCFEILEITRPKRKNLGRCPNRVVGLRLVGIGGLTRVAHLYGILRKLCAYLSKLIQFGYQTPTRRPTGSSSE